MIRYPLLVSKPTTFADVLGASITRWYESAEDFARHVQAETGERLSGSTVSRWLSGQTVPTMAKIEQLAPFVLDGKRRPVGADTLIGLAYPNLAGGSRSVRPVIFDGARTEIARKFDFLLGDDSPLPANKRDSLESLAESLLGPYSMYLRKRKVV